jgi:cell division protein FtsB
MNSTSVMKSGIIFGGTLAVFLAGGLAIVDQKEPDIAAEEAYHEVIVQEVQEAQTVVRNLKEPRADRPVRQARLLVENGTIEQ